MYAQSPRAGPSRRPSLHDLFSADKIQLSLPVSPNARNQSFENKSLLYAVRHISASLVKRSGISENDPIYASLLADIWGRSRYATLEVLHAKRARGPATGSQNRRASSASSATTASKEAQSVRKGKKDRKDGRCDAETDRRRERSRDALVRLLRRVVQSDIAENERRLTISLCNAPMLDIEALRRLWGIPYVIFEAASIHAYLGKNPQAVIPLYNSLVANADPDRRVFNLLHWHERNNPDPKSPSPIPATPPAVSKQIIARVVSLLLTKRRSPFFEKNMPTVMEVVLYAIAADPYILHFRYSHLRTAAFCHALQTYEYSRSFTATLENLQLARLNRLLKDIRAVRAIDADLLPVQPPLPAALSRRAVEKYCIQRDTLTDRALHAVFARYLTATPTLTMTEADFVRMYLSLVASGSDPGLAYWFAVLDHDGDGLVGPADIAHFYAQRKAESEKRNAILLADVDSFWVRLCAMCAVSPIAPGIDLAALKTLGREDREFVMCALLVRRVDDGNLINVAATVSSDVDAVDSGL